MSNRGLFATMLISVLLTVGRADYSYCVSSQPPDDLYFKHGIPEYEGQTPSFSEDYLLKMKTILDQYIDIIVDNAPPGYHKKSMGKQDAQLYYGAGGRALMFLDLYYQMAEVDQDLSERSLDLAQQYVDQAIAQVGWYAKYIGFLKGHPGVYSVGAAVYHALGQEETALEYVQVVRDVFNQITIDSPMGYDEGVAGLLYCADFLEAHFGEPLIERELIVNAGELLIGQGIQYSFSNGTLQWPNDDHEGAYWLGQGHGSSGTVHRLFKIPEIMENSAYAFYIEQTVKFWMGRQDETGQVYDYITGDPGYATMPYKIQWCHGAPGFISEFAMAHKLFGEEEYLERSKLAADLTIEQGILTKGLHYGHGTMGNLYMVLTYYQYTGDQKYLYYFYEMHKFVLDTPQLSDPEQMKAYDCYNYSIFVSSIGSAISAYGDFLGHYGKEEGAMDMRMATWEGPVMRQTQETF